MSNQRIIILYKDRSYKLVKENDLYKNFKEKEIKLLLFPSKSNSVIFYPIKPDKRLLASHFSITLEFDIGDFDYDENRISYKDSMKSHYKTDSVIDFIEYISIFYKNSGIAEVLESAILQDGFAYVTSIYPVHYHIDFGYANQYESIDSGELERYKSDHYLHIPAFSWINESRMYNISDILYTTDSNKNGSHSLPILLSLTDGYWDKIKYINNINELHLDKENIILLKSNEFNCYYLTTYEVFNTMCHIPSMSFDVIVSQPYLDYHNAEFAESILENIDHHNQIDRDYLARFVKEEYLYLFGYTYTIGDSYSFIIWATFNKDIIQYLAALYKNNINTNCIMIRYLGKMTNMTFTYKDILDGKFTKLIYEYIRRN